VRELKNLTCRGNNGIKIGNKRWKCKKGFKIDLLAADHHLKGEGGTEFIID